MLGTTQNLPGDIAELRAILAVRDEEIAASKAEIRVRDLLIEKLEHQLAGLRRHRFGPSSEALDQLALMLEDEEIAASAQDDANAIKAVNPWPLRWSRIRAMRSVSARAALASVVHSALRISRYSRSAWMTS